MENSADLEAGRAAPSGQTTDATSSKTRSIADPSIARPGSKPQTGRQQSVLDTEGSFIDTDNDAISSASESDDEVAQNINPHGVKDQKKQGSLHPKDSLKSLGISDQELFHTQTRKAPESVNQSYNDVKTMESRIFEAHPNAEVGHA